MREAKVPSVIPIYAIGVVWIAYALMFPLYRISHLLIATIVSVIAYFLLTLLIPKRTVLVEDPPEPIRTGNAEHDAKLAQWQSFQQDLAAQRGKITHTELAARLDSILATSGNMFEVLRGDASKFRQVRAFMTYYFPTTLSLLKRYEDYANNVSQGQHVSDSMRRIEQASEMIDDAFQNALDSLYRDEALNTEVEIEVMENMLRKDNLGAIKDPSSSTPTP